MPILRGKTRRLPIFTCLQGYSSARSTKALSRKASRSSPPTRSNRRWGREQSRTSKLRLRMRCNHYSQVRVMKVRIAVGLILAIFPASLAFAGFPGHEVCVYQKNAKGEPDKSKPKIVSKKQLALFFLEQDADTRKLAQNVDESPEYGPYWRRIFIDP